MSTEPALKKFRYEFPRFEAHFIEAPRVHAAVAYLKKTFPHNIEDVLPTLVEIPSWPKIWKTLDDDGNELPPKREG